MDVDITDPRLRKVESEGPGWVRIEYYLGTELVLTHFNGSVPIKPDPWRSSRVEPRQSPSDSIWRRQPTALKARK